MSDVSSAHVKVIMWK